MDEATGRRHRGNRANSDTPVAPDGPAVRLLGFRIHDGPAALHPVYGVIGTFDVAVAGIVLTGCTLRRRRNLELIVTEPEGPAVVIKDDAIRDQILQAASAAARFFGCDLSPAPENGPTPQAPGAASPHPSR